MWKHSKIKKPNIALRAGFLFLVVFLFSYGAFNYRFITAYLEYKLSGVVATKFEPDKKDTIHLPIASYKNTEPLPSDAELIVDRLGIRAPIVFNLPNDETVIFNSLTDGVVNYPNTVKPGEAGLSLILGHSSALPWYKGQYGSIFALLGQLKDDDLVYVRYRDGRTFTYKIYDSVVFSPLSNDDSYLKLEGDSNLVLLSCWPVGTSYKRIAIKAKLI